MGFEDLEIYVDPKATRITKIVQVKEPGHKIPIAAYLQIGQGCDVCNDVTAHVYSYKTKKIRCLRCKTTKQL